MRTDVSRSLTNSPQFAGISADSFVWVAASPEHGEMRSSPLLIPRRPPCAHKGIPHRTRLLHPSRRRRRTVATGQFSLALITRTCDPVQRSVSACEQISSSMSATSISVVDNDCRVLGISEGQMRDVEPFLKSSAVARRRDGGNGNGGGSRSARLSVAARDVLTRLPLLSLLLEQIIQGGIDPSLVNVAPQRTIGSNDPISAVFLHDLDAVNGGFFPSVS
jgi:hypothetical protein